MQPTIAPAAMSDERERAFMEEYTQISFHHGPTSFTYSYLSILYTKKQTMHQIGVVQIKCQLYWALLAFIHT